jgi:hypothetical protein
MEPPDRGAARLRKSNCALTLTDRADITAIDVSRPRLGTHAWLQFNAAAGFRLQVAIPEWLQRGNCTIQPVARQPIMHGTPTVIYPGIADE